MMGILGEGCRVWSCQGKAKKEVYGCGERGLK